MLAARLRRAAERRLSNFPAPYMLHLGCGSVHFAGWINIDRSPSDSIVDISWDVCNPLPLPDRSCSLLYHEHLLEHLTSVEASAFLSDCRRLLMPGGVMRVAMPSLEELCQKYFSDDWRAQEWLRRPEYQFIERKAEMINIAFRWWGHQWLYDREDLHYRLREAGFSEVRSLSWGQSEQPELRNRETRPDSLLICEAIA